MNILKHMATERSSVAGALITTAVENENDEIASSATWIISSLVDCCRNFREEVALEVVKTVAPFLYHCNTQYQRRALEFLGQIGPHVIDYLRRGEELEGARVMDSEIYLQLVTSLWDFTCKHSGESKRIALRMLSLAVQRGDEVMLAKALNTPAAARLTGLNSHVADSEDDDDEVLLQASMLRFLAACAAEGDRRIIVPASFLVMHACDELRTAAMAALNQVVVHGTYRWRGHSIPDTWWSPSERV